MGEKAYREALEYMVSVRSIRRQLGLTQSEFAKKLGVAKSTVGRWEIGQTKPSPLAEDKIDKLQLSRELPKVDSGSYLRAIGVAPRPPGAPLAEEAIRRGRDE